MASNASASERRRYRRFPAASLTAQVKTKRGLFNKWEDVEVSDFSVSGISLMFDDQPTLDQQLTLRLNLKMDMGEIKVEKIDALPKNKITHKDRWRLGLEFCDDKNGGKNNELKKQLERIKQILEKHDAVNERLKNQVV